MTDTGIGGRKKPGERLGRGLEPCGNVVGRQLVNIKCDSCLLVPKVFDAPLCSLNPTNCSIYLSILERFGLALSLCGIHVVGNL